MARSKTAASFLSVAVLASALATPAAFAAPFSAGNSFEIPLVQHPPMERVWIIAPQAFWGGNAAEIPLVTGVMAMPKPAHVAATRHSRKAAPAAVASSNPSCVGGYSWRYNEAGNWDTLPTRCNG